MKNLKILNLSENKIKLLPSDMKDCLTLLETINLNNNRLEDVFNAIDVLSELPNLRSLFINLNKEEQVDYILKKMPHLEHLNGLPVDREELYEDEEGHDQTNSKNISDSFEYDERVK